MLNLVQLLTKSTTYETLKSVDPESSSGPGSVRVTDWGFLRVHHKLIISLLFHLTKRL